ncbi:MAG: hypothetical protein IJ088_03855 [Clostridia bacterium]|nr:hypothetical protein [Clostridia bacterium]
MRKYRVRPSCPYCGEEHCYRNVILSDEEQETLDNYYISRAEERKRRTSIGNLLKDIENKPLVITRQFKCGMCQQEFEETIVILREDEVGFRSPDMIPMGIYPV